MSEIAQLTAALRAESSDEEDLFRDLDKDNQQVLSQPATSTIKIGPIHEITTTGLSIRL